MAIWAYRRMRRVLAARTAAASQDRAAAAARPAASDGASPENWAAAPDHVLEGEEPVEVGQPPQADSGAPPGPPER
jgi:hypothetical protein